MEGWADPSWRPSSPVDPRWAGQRCDGLVVLDADSAEAAAWVEKHIPGATRTMVVATPRGRHYYFAGTCAAGPRNAVAPGVDLKTGTGAYVLAPGAVHPSGERYRVVQGSFDHLVRWPGMPGGLDQPARPATTTSTIDRIPSGSRNATLARLAGALRRHGVPTDTLVTMLHTANVELCDPPLAQPEVVKIARSIGRYEPGEPLRTSQNGEDPWTPIGLPARGTAPPPPFAGRVLREPVLYAGRLHLLAGEPECGKTWLALVWATELLREQQPVLLLDAEDTADMIAHRVDLLAPDLDSTARAQLRYVIPVGQIPDHAWQVWADLRPRLVLVDAVGSCMAHAGLDPLDNRAVTSWCDQWRRFAHNTGAAVLLLDHVAKPQGDGTPKAAAGWWPIGAQAKLAVLDGAAFLLRAGVPLGPGRRGWSILHVIKDRLGAIRARTGSSMGRGAALARFTLDGSRSTIVEVEWSPAELRIT